MSTHLWILLRRTIRETKGSCFSYRCRVSDMDHNWTETAAKTSKWSLTLFIWIQGLQRGQESLDSPTKLFIQDIDIAFCWCTFNNQKKVVMIKRNRCLKWRDCFLSAAFEESTMERDWTLKLGNPMMCTIALSQLVVWAIISLALPVTSSVDSRFKRWVFHLQLEGQRKRALWLPYSQAIQECLKHQAYNCHNCLNLIKVRGRKKSCC